MDCIQTLGLIWAVLLAVAVVCVVRIKNEPR